MGEHDVLLEFHAHGGYVKVSAIDPLTRTEVSVVGAAKATEAELSRTAVAKLRYVLDKRDRVERPRVYRRPGIEV